MSIAQASAQRRINDFQRAYGERALHLAYHAALPVALDADLLHLLRINFFLDPPEPLPFTAESDLLLSPLCQEIAEGLYEIEAETRNILLQGFALTYQQTDRLQEVATLLWRYVDEVAPWADRIELERAQQLTALSFLAPNQAQQWLNHAEQNSGRTMPVEREWFIAMGRELSRRNRTEAQPLILLFDGLDEPVQRPFVHFGDLLYNFARRRFPGKGAGAIANAITQEFPSDYVFHIPRKTIASWLEGKVRRPREWSQVAIVAHVLGLTAQEADQLLQAAEHMTLSEKRNSGALMPDEQLALNGWIQDSQLLSSGEEPVSKVEISPSVRFDDLLRVFVQRLGKRGSSEAIVDAVYQKFFKDYVSRKTIESWLSGSVSRPREWSQVAMVASVLGLNIPETDQLLRAAGHMTLGDKKNSSSLTPAEKLALNAWTQGSQPLFSNEDLVTLITQSSITDLRNLLIKLYPNMYDARRVADDAQINTKKIDFEAPSIDRWQMILDEAYRDYKLESLAWVALEHHPQNNELKSVLRQLGLAFDSDWNPKYLADLSDILAAFYPTRIDARRIVDDAEISSHRIDFTGSTIKRWRAIIEETQRQDKLELLVQTVLREYGSNERLMRVSIDLGIKFDQLSVKIPMLTELRNAFVALYQEIDKIRQILDKARLNLSISDDDGSLINIWYKIVKEAHDKQQLSDLVTVALHENADNHMLKNVYQRYLDSFPS
jgi:hypothetical protein